MNISEIPIDEPTDETSADPEPFARKRRMPGQRNFSKTGEALFLHERRAAPPGAPRQIADLKLGVCICKFLAPWARPCSPCKWSRK